MHKLGWADAGGARPWVGVGFLRVVHPRRKTGGLSGASPSSSPAFQGPGPWLGLPRTQNQRRPMSLEGPRGPLLRSPPRLPPEGALCLCCRETMGVCMGWREAIRAVPFLRTLANVAHGLGHLSPSSVSRKAPWRGPLLSRGARVSGPLS